MDFKVKVEHDIPIQRLKDLLCGALEGGSNYWRGNLRYIYPKGQTAESLGLEFPHLDLPFIEGGEVVVSVPDEKDDFGLNQYSIQRGLQLLADKFPRHFQDFLNENEDAYTGDLFLQLCLFGKEIYG